VLVDPDIVNVMAEPCCAGMMADAGFMQVMAEPGLRGELLAAIGE